MIVSAMICDGKGCTNQGPAYERKSGRATKSQIKTLMRNQGWSSGKRDLCPTCSMKGKA